MKVTVKAFAEREGVEYSVAAGFLKFLENRKAISVVGTQKTATGRGKPASIYEVPDLISVNLAEVPVVESPVVQLPVAEEAPAQVEETVTTEVA